MSKVSRLVGKYYQKCDKCMLNRTGSPLSRKEKLGGRTY